MSPPYHYQATVLAVHDGDTLHLDVDLGRRINLTDRDLGFSTYIEGRRLKLHEDFRLYGINAPELANADGSGVAALNALLAMLHTPDGTAFLGPLTIRTYKQADHEKQEKYGRWLASLWLPGEYPPNTPSINDRMVSSGHAVPYFG